ncbi:MAG TPA: hypothetical protein VF157_00390 [Chloroflexota bacterium]
MNVASSAGAILPLAFGFVCLLFYGALKQRAEDARGQRRFYVLGFYRAVALAFGIVAVMVGISRLLALFVS